MSENEQAFNFDFEFQNRLADDGQMKEGLQDEIDRRLRKLTKGNTDITGASIILENEDPTAQIPYLYRARIVLYTRPDNIAADQTADTALGALKAALTAVERQVREKRDKLRERWKQPGADQPEFLDPAAIDADEDAGPPDTP